MINSRHGEKLAEDIRKIFEAAGLKAEIFPGAEPNPTDSSVTEGAEIYKKENCDLIVAVGGGSLWTVQKPLASGLKTEGKLMTTKASERLRRGPLRLSR
ncbi:Alcohol dehydrogenase [Methanosarcina siciliae T4/M]|uniref:Alcohol dehydrogenase n=1 Tax=Methanosarcina siciliae T4/M TaxID=1434120 RepID=A0A0E3P598_9EURY|nr:iron-containing alcohol dehydrogenase [Methanosarcina siciliae]AKB28963.1 Alcohol dehydrogenase [Methanosarcina siciliae T4/M]